MPKFNLLVEASLMFLESNKIFMAVSLDLETIFHFLLDSTSSNFFVLSLQSSKSVQGIPRVHVHWKHISVDATKLKLRSTTLTEYFTSAPLYAVLQFFSEWICTRRTALWSPLISFLFQRLSPFKSTSPASHCISKHLRANQNVQVQVQLHLHCYFRNHNYQKFFLFPFQCYLSPYAFQYNFLVQL